MDDSERHRHLSNRYIGTDDYEPETYLDTNPDATSDEIEQELASLTVEAQHAIDMYHQKFLEATIHRAELAQTSLAEIDGLTWEEEVERFRIERLMIEAECWGTYWLSNHREVMEEWKDLKWAWEQREENKNPENLEAGAETYARDDKRVDKSEVEEKGGEETVQKAQEGLDGCAGAIEALRNLAVCNAEEGETKFDKQSASEEHKA